MIVFRGTLVPLWTASLCCWCLALLAPLHPTDGTNSITYPLVPHHVQRRRLVLSDSDLRRRRDLGELVSPLYQGYGTHYIDLWCGSPPQRQTVIVDTGSGVTAFPCNGCNDCGVPKYHIDQLFNQYVSDTFQANTCDRGCLTSRSQCYNTDCQLSMAYAEGSRWDAFEAVDTCYVGGPHERPLVNNQGTQDALDPLLANQFAFDLVFGCQTLLTGLFKTQLADGIMGMNTRREAYWSQMYQAGKLQTQQFSLCYSRSPTAAREGTEAGALTLGGVDERFHTSPMVFTPNASEGREGFFTIRVRRVWLRNGSAGESAKSNKLNPSQGVRPLEVSDTILNSGGIIVDSGTTDTYWNSGMAAEFQRVFRELSGHEHDNLPWSLTQEQLLALPTVLFQLESNEEANAGLDPFQTPGLAGSIDPKHPYDVIFAFPPSHYMEFDPETGFYTSRFYITESRGSVLGANAMMGHSILFDADNDRIGWAESDCDYTTVVNDNGFYFSITGTLATAPPNDVPSTETPPPPEPVTPPVDPILPPSPTPQSEPESLITAPRPTPATIKLAPKTPMGEVKDTLADFEPSCNTLECWLPLICALAILVCCGGCLSYILLRCCCPGRDRQDYKYSPAPGEDQLELTTFQDEPEHDDEDAMELQ